MTGLTQNQENGLWRRLFTGLLPSLLLLTLWIPPAFAQNSDFVCYLQVSGGTVDLSSLCGKAGGQAAAVITAPVAISAVKSASTAEQTFLAEFQDMARSYPASIGQVLQEYVSDRQPLLLASAKAMCRMMRSGGDTIRSTMQKQVSSGDASSGEVVRQQITVVIRK